jgi:hypothetical protein
MKRHERRAAKNKERRAAKRSDVTPLDEAFTNSQEFIGANIAIAADVLSGRISTKAANAITARQRTILKMLELQLKAQHRSVGGGQ